MSLVDLEDHMDFGDEARRMVSEAKRVADGEKRCPTCKGTGSQISNKREYKCLDCDGSGWLTRYLQHRYYGEAGYSDAQCERDMLEEEEA